MHIEDDDAPVVAALHMVGHRKKIPLGRKAHVAHPALRLVNGHADGILKMRK